MPHSELENAIAIARDPNRSEDERTSAIHALARFPAEEAIPALLELMHDNELSIRWTAASTLRKFGREMLIPLLRAIATQPASVNFYESAHHALVRFGDPEIEKILEPVVEALKQPPTSSTAAVEAMNALEQLQTNA